MNSLNLKTSNLCYLEFIYVKLAYRLLFREVPALVNILPFNVLGTTE